MEKFTCIEHWKWKSLQQSYLEKLFLFAMQPVLLKVCSKQVKRSCEPDCFDGKRMQKNATFSEQNTVNLSEKQKQSWSRVKVHLSQLLKERGKLIKRLND